MIETARLRLYSKRHPICFTHGDLRLWNVLVQDGCLSGLMDFGSSEWYPEYCEHATATWGVPLWWRDAVIHGFCQCQEEIAVEDTIFSVGAHTRRCGKCLGLTRYSNMIVFPIIFIDIRTTTHCQS